MITPRDFIACAHSDINKPFRLEIRVDTNRNKGGFMFSYCTPNSVDGLSNSCMHNGREIRLRIEGRYVATTFPFKNFVECVIYMDVFPSRKESKDGYQYYCHYTKRFRGHYSSKESYSLLDRLMKMMDDLFIYPLYESVENKEEDIVLDYTENLSYDSNAYYGIPHFAY